MARRPDHHTRAHLLRPDACVEPDGGRRLGRQLPARRPTHIAGLDALRRRTSSVAAHSQGTRRHRAFSPRRRLADGIPSPHGHRARRTSRAGLAQRALLRRRRYVSWHPRHALSPTELRHRIRRRTTRRGRTSPRGSQAGERDAARRSSALALRGERRLRHPPTHRARGRDDVVPRRLTTPKPRLRPAFRAIEALRYPETPDEDEVGYVSVRRPAVARSAGWARGAPCGR